MCTWPEPSYWHGQSIAGGCVVGDAIFTLQPVDCVLRQKLVEPLFNDVGEPTTFGRRTAQKSWMLGDLNEEDIRKASEYPGRKSYGKVVTSELVERGELGVPAG